MNLLVIAVDHLHAGYLGCYGNTWVATPALDRLASNGFVFDQAHVDSLDPTATYDAWWRGRQSFTRRDEPAGPTFADVVRQAGLAALLAADDPRLFNHVAAATFADVLELPAPPGDAPTATDAEATHAARTFAAVSEKLEELSEPFALWFHTSALAGPWDAPAALRERYRDEEDPPIPTFTTLPSQTLPADVDLDERFALAMAYAAQVSLVDVCLGGLLEHLDETGLDRRTAVVVCGVRGLALGEHQQVGFDDGRLYAENVRVPWLVRLPEGRDRLRRSQALVQPCDLLPTVAELLGTSHSGGGRSLLPLMDGTATTVRDRTPIVGSGEFALRTPRWSLRVVEPTEHDDARAELFVKPDDFWEVNDVADRCPDAVDELRQCYADTVAALAEGREPPPLPAAENLLAET